MRSAPLRATLFWKVVTAAAVEELNLSVPTMFAADRSSPSEARAVSDVHIHRCGTGGKTAAVGRPLERAARGAQARVKLTVPAPLPCSTPPLRLRKLAEGMPVPMFACNTPLLIVVLPV